MTTVRLIGIALLVGLAGCQFEEQAPVAQSAPAKIPAASFEKLSSRHLPNPIRVHERVISGGLPEGDEAFAELQELGIKTIISVDGAKPDVAMAQKYGMRYVHLPHGYDGVPEQRAKELAKAVRDLPVPIYLHCHHGKHRSPAATAVACVGAGLIRHDDVATLLALAGTSEAYRGLFQSAESAHPLDKALLDELQAEFPAVAKLPAMAGVMVEIEHIHDLLKAIEKAGWTTPADQPALVPDHEALLLHEQFKELLRTKDVQSRPERFQQLTQDAEVAAQALENALKSPATSGEEASKLFLVVSNNCKACHQQFRDVPLREKQLPKN
jgi:protein tyrosine phosphatase (PTP) superfamily phosphohydrolase (DUF442 family)